MQEDEGQDVGEECYSTTLDRFDEPNKEDRKLITMLSYADITDEKERENRAALEQHILHTSKSQRNVLSDFFHGIPLAINKECAIVIEKHELLAKEKDEAASKERAAYKVRLERTATQFQVTLLIKEITSRKRLGVPSGSPLELVLNEVLKMAILKRESLPKMTSTEELAEHPSAVARNWQLLNTPEPNRPVVEPVVTPYSKLKSKKSKKKKNGNLKNLETFAEEVKLLQNFLKNDDELSENIAVSAVTPARTSVHFDGILNNPDNGHHEVLKKNSDNGSDKVLKKDSDKILKNTAAKAAEAAKAEEAAKASAETRLFILSLRKKKSVTGGLLSWHDDSEFVTCLQNARVALFENTLCIAETLKTRETRVRLLKVYKARGKPLLTKTLEKKQFGLVQGISMTRKDAFVVYFRRHVVCCVNEKEPLVFSFLGDSDNFVCSATMMPVNGEVAVGTRTGQVYIYSSSTGSLTQVLDLPIPIPVLSLSVHGPILCAQQQHCVVRFHPEGGLVPPYMFRSGFSTGIASYGALMATLAECGSVWITNTFTTGVVRQIEPPASISYEYSLSLPSSQAGTQAGTQSKDGVINRLNTPITNRYSAVHLEKDALYLLYPCATVVVVDFT